MTRAYRALSWVGATLVALVGLLALAGPAAADSFSFGYSTGGHRHYHPGYYGRPHYGPPRYAFSYYYGRPYYYPPPVYYYPQYVPVAPPPVVYVPVPRAPAMAAQPSSPVYQTEQGQYCREYQGTLNIGGQQQPSYGTACLQQDGSWKLMN